MDGFNTEASATAVELKATIDLLRGLVATCAMDILQLRVRPEDGAATLDRVRKDLRHLAALLDGFVALHVEHELASGVANESERETDLAAVERAILSRAESLRRTLGTEM